MNNPQTLVIIPARGGSKGIPRKNLRNLAGKPLIFYSIKNALNSKYQPDVYVSSDDTEILTIAKKFGAKTIDRNKQLAQDHTTLDPVIFDAYKQASELENKVYDLIITLQPTSPLLKTSSLDKAITTILNNPSIDTILSAKEDTHLTWKKEGNDYFPNFEKRVNRQYLDPTFKETGGFLITRNSIISQSNRIGSKVELFLLKEDEAIDIDTYEDWNLCEYHLTKKKILFIVSGYPEIGLGHVYNTLLIANNILNHSIQFLVDKKSELAFQKINSYHYPVAIQQEENIINDIESIDPDIVINDCLDTDRVYIKSLKELGYKVINFEDLGSGIADADLVINAMYPEKEVYPNHYFGHKYFCLRDEFIISKQKNTLKKEVSSVLLTFGGVDPLNLTETVLSSIYDYCITNNIEINVILGLGYKKAKSLQNFKRINIFKNINNISDYMYNADIAFTSAGRTTFEIAAIGTPTIVICQNEREATHFFAYAEHGFNNLGLGSTIHKEEILNTFIKLIDNHDRRLYMNQLMISNDLKKGKERVINKINEIIKQ